jgi:hypothetical protein
MAKTCSLTISLTPDEKRELKAIAKAGGITLSDMVKESLEQTRGIKFDSLTSFRVRVCRECGKKYNAFCVPCTIKAGKTPREILQSISFLSPSSSSTTV